ncbi:hypothetical protein OEA41_005292 [Lepraria neglecta]|uniref:3-dehydrosphinganine reductase n=1 Tax=Lepraria neglecta TaxID=209136 RepID=A0AAD9YZI7_9LECA|nr:hypothetical protein OEA41_005292 [Lepraria neglecta]
MGGFQSKNQFPVDGRTVIVTGGSQGMGKALAELLAKKGANVLIVARTVGKLETALKDICVVAVRPSTQRFHYISADLTSPTESTRIITEATAWNNNQTPDILICCAGSATPGLFIDLPTSTIKEQIETNYYSSAYMAHAFLQPWLQNPSGSKSQEAKHIVFTSSLVAFLPLVGYSLYTPSKVALRALSDTLSQELLLYHPLCNIRTHTIFPGTIFSPGLEIENQSKPAITKKLEESDGGQTCEEVAASSIKGLEKGEEMISSGIMGVALKAGMLGSSRRNGWGIVDTVVGWIVMIVLVVVRRDMDGTVRKWGKERLGKN